MGSSYLAKIMGYDLQEVYGVDKEMTSNSVKDSRTPFDLLLFPELPAENIDLFSQLSKDYDAVCDWFKQTFTELGCPELCDVPLSMPHVLSTRSESLYDSCLKLGDTPSFVRRRKKFFFYAQTLLIYGAKSRSKS